MPVLLAPEKAPALETLLNDTDTRGLTWQIEPASAGSVTIAGIGALSEASSLEIAFIANPKYLQALDQSQAAAVIVTPAMVETLKSQSPALRIPLVVCASPYLLYARVGQWFEQQLHPQPPGQRHPTAWVDPQALVDSSAVIGPFAVVEAGAVIGARVQIGAHAVIGESVQLGADTVVHPRVTLYPRVRVGKRCNLLSGAVIGGDGFGFAPDSTQEKGAWCRIPQFGSVLIGDDVEVGANTTIDRGALEDTQIGNGVKIDNQIMIGHNCVIGDHTAMAACVGIAGSTVIGKRCSIGGAAMIGGHLRITDDVFISAATPVHSHIDKPGQYTGFFPMTNHSQWERNAVAVRHLATMAKRIKALENK